MAILVGVAILNVGPGAGAQTVPVYAGVTVTPGILSTPGKITVAGPGLPGAQGCKFGQILALATVPAGLPLTSAQVLVLSADLDIPWSFPVSGFVGKPFEVGTFTIFLTCGAEAGGQQTFATGAQFTIEPGSTTTTASTSSTTSTTTSSSSTTAPTSTTIAPGVQGTVDPTAAQAGVTTITIRGGGFKAAAQLQISLKGTSTTSLGTTNATDTGAYAATLVLPASAPSGGQQLVVTGPGPDGAIRSTTAALTVTAAGSSVTTVAGTGGNRGTNTAAGATSSLAKTGSGRASFETMAGLAALSVGALLMGLSHPAVPTRGRHRRRRVVRRG